MSSETLAKSQDRHLPIHEIRDRNEAMMDELIKYKQALDPGRVSVDQEYTYAFVEIPSGVLEIQKRHENRALYPKSIRYQLVYHEAVKITEDEVIGSYQRHIAFRAPHFLAEESEQPFEKSEPDDEFERKEGSKLSREEELEVALDLGLAVKAFESQSLALAG